MAASDIKTVQTDESYKLLKTDISSKLDTVVKEFEAISNLCKDIINMVEDGVSKDTLTRIHTAMDNDMLNAAMKVRKITFLDSKKY